MFNGRSADVLNLGSVFDSLAQVASDGALEELQQEREHRTRERCVPTALRLLVTDECVLGLHLQELQVSRSALC